jgi:hypothetical protein
MVNLFLAEPDIYARPVDYLDRALETLVEPPVRYVFETPFYRVAGSSVGSYERATTFDDEVNGLVGLREVYPRAPAGPARVLFYRGGRLGIPLFDSESLLRSEWAERT